jgi:two-component system, OmpR family, phosphate regulon sensor histidine kinase PhoR
MARTFSRKIIAVYAVFICIIIVFLFVYFISLMKETHLSIIKREMEEKLNFIELFFREEKALRPNDTSRVKDVLIKSSSIMHLRITIVNFDGKVIADTEAADVSILDNHLYRPEIQQSRNGAIGYSIRHSVTIGIDTLYCSKKSDSFYIRVAKPLEEVNESVSSTTRGVLAAGFILLLGSIFIIVLVSRRISRPIKETGEFAAQFAAGNYETRIMNYCDDEIGSVQRTLNLMAETIADTIAKISSEREKLRTTLETIPDGIALISADRKITLTNDVFKRLYDTTRIHEGKLYFEVIRSKNLNARIDDIIATGKPSHFEEESSHGKIFDVYLNSVKEENNVRSVLLVLHDITEMKKVERIKSDLVGNMSHELKTPIAIMKGYLETIRESLKTDNTCKPMIDKAIENADRQSSLINDILKLHMMESSDEFQTEEVKLQELISNCTNIIMPKAAAKDIIVSINLSPLPLSVKGNKFLAEEIFFNLIDNAVNYNNPRGHVVIDAETNEKSCIVTIDDTGIGIPSDSMSRIFERFYRVDKSRSRATGGTGLGLSIVKHAAEILGWKVTAVPLHKGTRFSVEIPLPKNR